MEPVYFGLIWQHELELLKPLLEAVAARREAVLAEWWELYSVHFGDRRSLSRAEFFQIHGADLDATVATLKRESFTDFVIAVRAVGEQLAERHVPFTEVVASMHLFEEAAMRTFPDSADLSSYRLFDKISHCRTAVLAESYFKSRTASVAARVEDLEREAAQLPHEARTSFHGLVGVTPEMRALYERIEAVAGVRSTVLIVGESGTGKELIARAIHECSRARHAPFVALNCAALPRELIESELFGYTRGAFSGATGEYLGLFRAAQGGTLFLDEITEMTAATQSKLLRTLQEHTVRPIGSTRELRVEARVIASTNREPAEAVRCGNLREDLYYRLGVNTLKVSPLRERRDDIPLLVEHFIALFNEKLTRATPIVEVDTPAREAMRIYSWPGNVRELSNAIEQAFTFCRSNLITLADLPAALAGRSTAVPERREPEPALNMADYQRDLIERALLRTGGNKLKAAQLLGISRKGLYDKLRRYGFGATIRRG
ncbi:MAG TPA: sigma 54-interacting transcriptional regulator [Candidatus Binataceae bacterium]|nr:sigma 54-interacting transcriptional regulator [Candidatus Binataceae bacterium]